MPIRTRHFIFLSVLLYLAFVLIMPKWGHQGDMESWLAWSRQMHENGLTRIYEIGSNYMPGFIYMLWMNTKLQQTATNIQDNLYVFKFMVLLFDILGAWLAVYYVRDSTRRFLAYAFLLLNPAFIYNTVVWAQVDAIFTALGFLALLAAIERRFYWSCFFLVVALNFKLQALVFIPVIGLVLLPQFLFGLSWRRVFLTLVVLFGAQVLMIFPFLLKGRALDVWNIIAHSVDYYPVVSMAAMNIWFFFIPGDVEHHAYYPDTGLFLGLTYKTWGFILFTTAVFLACWPMFRALWKGIVRKQPSAFPLEKIFLVAALTAVAFFYFNTQMHERYFHPALISLAAYTFLTGRIFPLALGSVAYFLNLEFILRSLALTNYGTLVFKPWFVSVLFLVLILYLYRQLYAEPAEPDRTIDLSGS